MAIKKHTFKERMRRSDLKQRSKAKVDLRKRMGTNPRRHNRFDNMDNTSRPLADMMLEVTSGTAIPSRDLDLDPRSLADLLIQAAPKPTPQVAETTTSEQNGTAAEEPSASGRANRKAKAGESLPGFALSNVVLDADHPLAFPEMDVARLLEAEALASSLGNAAGPSNRNHYKRSGEAYLFWDRVGLHPLLMKALREMRFTHPTPVQEEVLPALLLPREVLAALKLIQEKEANGGEPDASENGGSKRKRSKKRRVDTGVKDVVVSAETGSGKTLVFALPILQSILTKMDEDFAAQEASVKTDGSAKRRRQESEASKDADSSVAKGVKGKGKKARASASGTEGGSANEDLEQNGEVESSTEAQDPEAAKLAAMVAMSRAMTPQRTMHTLIVTPTRELALQIKEAMSTLCKFAPHVGVGCIVGGMAPEKQQRILNRHPHVLISTPGRLWDLMQKNEGAYLGHSISRRLNYIVLDEADKLLQSGRFNELQSMLERVHNEVLPAGFGQDREEGAEILEPSNDAQEGTWDEETKTFIPFSKVDKKNKKKKNVPVKAGKKTGKRGSKSEDEYDEEEEMEEDEMEDEEMEEEHNSEGADGGRYRARKDLSQPMVMPPPPPEGHRVVTVVTSATLSLSTNYERRDFKSNKSIIRTSNANTMSTVMQHLNIQPSNASVFNITPDAGVVAKINETYLRCPDNSKDLYLYYFLRSFNDRAIIFVNAISMLRRLVKLLEILNIPVVGLHASMQQRQRLKFIDKFKTGVKRVLIATDVASRGLDIEGLKYVIHYQVPRSTDSYIHRCGRTARCGGTGLSVLMVNAMEFVSFKKLLESLGRSEKSMEVLAMEPSVVHHLHPQMKLALQIDKLKKEMEKSRASNQWATRASRDADIDVDDMVNDEANEENREKVKAIKSLKRHLDMILKKESGRTGGKGSFRTSASALGIKEAEQKLSERAKRQTVNLSAKEMKQLKQKEEGKQKKQGKAKTSKTSANISKTRQKLRAAKKEA